MSGLLEGSKVFFRRNGSTILTVTGVAGVISTAVLTAKGTTKASYLLDEAKQEKGDELTVPEKVLVAAPAYIPALLTGLGTVACIFGANVLNKKQQESLASAYILLNTKFKEYRNQVMELYGEDANDKVDEAIVNKNVSPEQEIELFYDQYSERYFESTLFKVQQAEYFLNRELIMKDYAYLNEWYELLDIPCVEDGWEFGWSISQCIEMYWQPWLDFSHQNKKLDDGRDCHVVGFWQEPIEDFADYC